jgi:hypothetical protein
VLGLADLPSIRRSGYGNVSFVPTSDARLLRWRHNPRALLRERAALQGKRLIAKQHLYHHVTLIAGIKRVLCDQVDTVSDDLVEHACANENDS